MSEESFSAVSENQLTITHSQVWFLCTTTVVTAVGLFSVSNCLPGVVNELTTRSHTHTLMCVQQGRVCVCVHVPDGVINVDSLRK